MKQATRERNERRMRACWARRLARALRSTRRRYERGMMTRATYDTHRLALWAAARARDVEDRVKAIVR